MSITYQLNIFKKSLNIIPPLRVLCKKPADISDYTPSCPADSHLPTTSSTANPLPTTSSPAAKHLPTPSCPATDILPTASCRSSTRQLGDSCFWVDDRKDYNWTQACEVCRSINMNLASIHSQTELDFIHGE